MTQSFCIYKGVNAWRRQQNLATQWPHLTAYLPQAHCPGHQPAVTTSPVCLILDPAQTPLGSNSSVLTGKYVAQAAFPLPELKGWFFSVSYTPRPTAQGP